MKKTFKNVAKIMFFAVTAMTLFTACPKPTDPDNPVSPVIPKEEPKDEPKDEQKEEVIFTVSGTDGISISYKKSDKLLVQQYYIYNSKDILILHKYNDFSEAFNFKYVDTGATYTYKIFYKLNDEQKILDGSITIEKGNGEFKTNDYATATFEKGVLKITNIKIPEIEGAVLNNVNFSLNSGEGGWKKDYLWITVLYASNDEISSGTLERDVYDILFSKNLNPNDFDGKTLWIDLSYSFKFDNVDYGINLFENGYFAFTFENPEKDVVRDSAVPQDASFVVFDANNLKEFPSSMNGPSWQFNKSLKHDEPYNKSMFLTPANNGTWATIDFTFDETLNVSGKTVYVVLKGLSATSADFDSIDFRLVSDETHISNINLRPADSENYKVYELPVSNFSTLWSENGSILSANLSTINKLTINFLEFTNPLWIEAIYLK